MQMTQAAESKAGSGTVLVADDHDDVRTMVRVLLELDGHDVLEAPDGMKAWELVLRRRPAVVIADAFMRGYDGLELCRMIKANGLAATRLIVYTAGLANEEDSRRAGCDAYFLKTDSPKRLRETVRAFTKAA